MYTYKNEKFHFHHSFDEHPLRKNFNDEAPHAHKRNEILYFISGKANYLVEGNIYKLVPGSIMIMRSGEFHKIIIEDDQPYERICLHFDVDLSLPIDNRNVLLSPFEDREIGVGNFFSPNEIWSGHIYDCFKSIESSPEESEMHRISVTVNLFTILYEIKRAFDERAKNQENQEKPVKQLSNEIIAYINANITRDLSLEILSERFFISKNHLNRIFKNATGVTVWEYIKLKRLIIARNSILGGASAISACQSSGFNDYSAFYRAYKERFGVSPKQIQK